MTRARQRPAFLRLATSIGAGVAVALAAGGGAAGAATPHFGEVVDVEVVDLAIVAAGADGGPVTDLTADELAVYDDGVRVKIDQLVRLSPPAGVARPGGQAVAPGPAGVAAVAPGAASAGEPLHVAIFLDEVNVGAASRRMLLAEVAAVLRDGLRPADRVMLAVYDGATRVVLPFSSDRKRLLAALEEVEVVSPARLIVEQERRATLESLAMDASGEHGWSPCLHIAEIVDSYSERENQRVERAAGAFGLFADGLAGIRGRKMVLHVSDGIPLRAGLEMSELATRLCNGVAAARGEGGGDTTAFGSEVYGPEQRGLDAVRYDTSAGWRETAARASASNVVVYPIQAGRSGESRLPGAENELRRSTSRNARSLEGSDAHGSSNLGSSTHSDNLQDTLYLLADETGGRALLGGGDVGQRLAAALAEQQAAYLLSYTPPAARESKLHRVRIEVSRPGVTLRHRTLYRERSLHEQIAGQLLSRLLYGDPDENPVASFELVDVTPGLQGAVKARFRLAVPLADLSLVAREELRVGGFTVLLAVADSEGRSSPVREKVVPVRVAATAPPDGTFDWEVEIAVRPGKQRVGLALRDEVDGELSFLVRELVVGARKR